MSLGSRTMHTAVHSFGCGVQWPDRLQLQPSSPPPAIQLYEGSCPCFVCHAVDISSFRLMHEFPSCGGAVVVLLSSCHLTPSHTLATRHPPLLLPPPQPIQLLTPFHSIPSLPFRSCHIFLTSFIYSIIFLYFRTLESLR